MERGKMVGRRKRGGKKQEGWEEGIGVMCGKYRGVRRVGFLPVC